LKHLVYNEELPSKIRRALISEAKRRDIRVNDLAGELLAAHVGLIWELSGHPYRVERARIDKIRVPERLHRLIRAEALGVTDGSGTMRGVVLSILASHFDLAEVSKIRRPRKEIT